MLGSWEWDIASGNLKWSDQTFRNFGLEPQSFQPTFDDYLSRLHPDDRELVMSTVQTAAVSGEPFDYFHRLIRPDGEVRTLHARGRIAEGPGGGARMIGTGQDVTEMLALQAERSALATEAEIARRNKFLSDATHEMYASMDYEWRLRELAHFVVPTLGDWCAVDILQADGSFKRLAVVHEDPEMVRLATEMTEEYPEDPESPTSRSSVIRSGKPVFMAHLSREMIDSGARDRRHAKMIHTLGLKSFIIAPLIARGKPLGTLTLVMAHSGRTYDERDVELTVELARRAAVAIDNARLHKELLETQERFQFLADTIPVQVWTATSDGDLEYVSRRTAEYFQRSQAEIIGSGWLDVVHPDDRERTIEAWTKSLTTGAEYEIEFRLWSPGDNDWLWHLGRAVPLRDDDGKIVRWFGSNTNIDAHKRMLDERERLQHEAQAANRAKMEFLAAMSHELRTPLNAINGYAELLLMEITGSINDDQRNFISRMLRSGKFLLGLINDVLSFAKIDAGVLEVRKIPVDLGALLESVHALVEPQIKSKNQHYAYRDSGDPCKVIGDPEKIEQIILNLLTNASKFTPEGGSISLTCETRDGMACVKVTDNGRGIPEDKLAAIFDPFVQIDRGRNSSSQQGVGLGLAISRELARAMDGDVTVDSTEGEGSTFTLLLRLE